MHPGKYVSQNFQSNNYFEKPRDTGSIKGCPLAAEATDFLLQSVAEQLAFKPLKFNQIRPCLSLFRFWPLAAAQLCSPALKPLKWATTIYADSWQCMVGESVKEAGLFFVTAGS
jgi:hypothetical protein